MEDKITEAESSLHAAQQALNNPAVLANRDKLHDACTTLESAQQRVQSLYARWEDLESRRS
jgi:ATP-binding cassette subfamily F protein uup